MITDTRAVRLMGAFLSLGLVGGCAVDIGAEDPTEATLVTAEQEARKPRPPFDILGPDGKIRGKTVERWSAEWWRWAHGIPNTTHPILDTTGEFCNEDQTGPVFFLAGTFGGSATRTCTIPHGKPVFFPIINLAADNCGVPPADQLPIADIIAFQETFADHVTAIELTVDGTVIGNDKDELSPFLIDVTEFSYFVPEEDSLYDFPFGLEFSGQCSPSFSAGYYVMLKLERGDHTLHFAATQDNGFALDTTYQLHVR